MAKYDPKLKNKNYKSYMDRDGVFRYWGIEALQKWVDDRPEGRKYTVVIGQGTRTKPGRESIGEEFLSWLRCEHNIDWSYCKNGSHINYGAVEFTIKET